MNVLEQGGTIIQEISSSGLPRPDYIDSVLQVAPLAVCTIEMPSMRYVQANANYCDMVTSFMTPGEIVGRTVFEVLPTQNPLALEALYRAHEKNEPTRFETISSTTQETTKYWTGAVMPIMRSGSSTYVLALLVEVTDKVMAERAAEEKTFQLKSALEKLRHERQKKDEFVAMAVHELRTPITSLKAMTQLLLRLGNKITPDELASRLQRLDKQASELNRLIGDLLDTTKVAADKLSMSTVPTFVCELVRDVAAQFAALNPTHEIRTEIGPTCGHPAMVDPGRLTQVITNLLGNAVHYSDVGTEILVRVSCTESDVTIEVRDQGVGINPENLEKIFECYFQAPDRKRSGGLGLGLYLAKDMVTRMSGKIWAESAGEGTGSSFFVQFKKVLRH